MMMGSDKSKRVLVASTFSRLFGTLAPRDEFMDNEFKETVDAFSDKFATMH